MKRNKLNWLAGGLLAMVLTAASCKQNTGDTSAKTANGSTAVLIKEPPVKRMPFSADSAYAHIEKQVSFGPRIPGTPAHDRCAEYLESVLRRFADSVSVQKAMVTAYDGKSLPIRNIIAYLNPGRKTSVLLSSHYDSRPWADQDSVDIKKPILAANDGASGVGVILEMARQIHLQAPEVGIVILLNDAEDYGKPEFAETGNEADSYCLGTQYWAKNLNKTVYVADYGIVLDMVGARYAKFLQEEHSAQYAPQVVDKIWKTAAALGYSDYFIFNHTYPITDDHLYINRIAQIPTVDIVDYDGTRPKGFGYYWHTHADNMDIIDKNTLKAVGETLMSVIYTEKAQSF